MVVLAQIPSELEESRKWRDRLGGGASTKEDQCYGHMHRGNELIAFRQRMEQRMDHCASMGYN
jgi:hypothetical protein